MPTTHSYTHTTHTNKYWQNAIYTYKHTYNPHKQILAKCQLHIHTHIQPTQTNIDKMPTTHSYTHTTHTNKYWQNANVHIQTHVQPTQTNIGKMSTYTYTTHTNKYWQNANYTFVHTYNPHKQILAKCQVHIRTHITTHTNKYWQNTNIHTSNTHKQILSKCQRTHTYTIPKKKHQQPACKLMNVKILRNRNRKFCETGVQIPRPTYSHRSEPLSKFYSAHFLCDLNLYA